MTRLVPGVALLSIWVLGGLAPILATLRDDLVPPLKVVRLVETDGRWWNGPFEAGKVYPSTTEGTLPAGIAVIGSWIDGDA